MSYLSVVVITKNEEKNIKECLESVKFADEIIIVDDFSTDKTRDIANKYTKKIFLNKEENLGLQKRFALSKALGEWILVLDADERASQGLRAEIKKVIKEKNDIIAYNIFYENFFFGHRVRFGNQNYYKTRLFKRGFGTISDNKVHEEIIIKKGKVEFLKGKIIHYSYRSLKQVLLKFYNYSKDDAKRLFFKGEKFKPKKLFLYPLHMFLSLFIKDKGYKDNIWGFLLSICFGLYEFFIYWNLYKIEKTYGKIPQSAH